MTRLDNEAYMYWTASTQLSQARRDGDSETEADMRDELEVLHDHSDWASLRTVCQRRIERKSDDEATACAF